MGQIFRPSTNTISRVSLFGALFFLAGLVWVSGELYRSSYVTRAGTPGEQPVPFSSEHHGCGGCIDGHQPPEKSTRPREEISSVNWQPPADQLKQGRELLAKYNVKSLTDCYTCHR